MHPTSEQQAILAIFRERNITEGVFLSSQVLNRERRNLPRNIQNHWDSILKSLTASGYMTYDPLGYGLTKQGYYHLHHPSA